MSLARPSLALLAALLGAIGALTGCGGGGAGAGGTGDGKADPVADTAPCERLTAAMAERVVRAPEIQKPEAGVDGCSLRAISTSFKRSGQRAASLSLGVPQALASAGGKLPTDVADMRKETDEPSTTTRDLDIGTDGFISFSKDPSFALLAWTDGEATYLLDYNAWKTPQEGEVPVDELIAIAKEIAG